MQRIEFTEPNQEATFSGQYCKATIKWLSSIDSHAIMHISTDIGFSSLLHLSSGVRGSIFEMLWHDIRLELIVDDIQTFNCKITDIVVCVAEVG